MFGYGGPTDPISLCRTYIFFLVDCREKKKCYGKKKSSKSVKRFKSYDFAVHSIELDWVKYCSLRLQVVFQTMHVRKSPTKIAFLS